VKVGPLLILGEDEETGSVRPWQDLRALALAAEEAGLDSVWIYDHLLYHFPNQEPMGVWEGWTIWAALAEATSRVELGALVLCTAFRNPAVLAKMAVTLDAVSNNRIVLGIGAGWHPAEFEAFGLNFNRKVDQFEESVKIIAPLVRDGKVDVQGEFHSANNCVMLPAPQRPIPLLIAGKQPRMLGLVARYADQYNTAWHGHVASIEERVGNLHLACEKEDRDPESVALTVGVNVAFPELGASPDGSDDPMKYIAGDVEHVADAFRAYDARGVAHLNVNLAPHTVEGMALLGQATALARAD
jgi:alkanesulfonate monooxygenase SsuD/methylene tetrahydromethanopterin reductase-like flavin-dependent oxidoreductase (luciferase family)